MLVLVLGGGGGDGAASWLQISWQMQDFADVEV